MKFRVSQGSVLGPLLFTFYMLSQGNIIYEYCLSCYCYVKDMQLYVLAKLDEKHQLNTFDECVKDITHWMLINLFLLDSYKTEVLILGPHTARMAFLFHHVQQSRTSTVMQRNRKR